MGSAANTHTLPAHATLAPQKTTLKCNMSTELTTLSTAFDQPGHPPATMTEYKGVRFLHLGTSWVQGAMELRKPDAITLEYVQMMMMWTLFERHPRHIVQLGLGSGALTKFCYNEFEEAKITTVELNPNVIAMCAAWFGLPPNDARLNVLEMNALDFVNDARNHNSIDILQVDLYDEHASAPVLNSVEFYQACHDCLRDGGLLTANIFGAGNPHDEAISNLSQVFDAVAWLPEVHDANVVVIGFKNAPEIDFRLLYARALEIKNELNLPAKRWVNGLKEWMMDQAE